LAPKLSNLEHLRRQKVTENDTKSIALINEQIRKTKLAKQTPWHSSKFLEVTFDSFQSNGIDETSQEAIDMKNLYLRILANDTVRVNPYTEDITDCCVKYEYSPQKVYDAVVLLAKIWRVDLSLSKLHTFEEAQQLAFHEVIATFHSAWKKTSTADSTTAGNHAVYFDDTHLHVLRVMLDKMHVGFIRFDEIRVEWGESGVISNITRMVGNLSAEEKSQIEGEKMYIIEWGEIESYFIHCRHTHQFFSVLYDGIHYQTSCLFGTRLVNILSNLVDTRKGDECAAIINFFGDDLSYTQIVDITKLPSSAIIDLCEGDTLEPLEPPPKKKQKKDGTSTCSGTAKSVAGPAAAPASRGKIRISHLQLLERLKANPPAWKLIDEEQKADCIEVVDLIGDDEEG